MAARNKKERNELSLGTVIMKKVVFVLTMAL